MEPGEEPTDGDPSPLVVLTPPGAGAASPDRARSSSSLLSRFRRRKSRSKEKLAGSPSQDSLMAGPRDSFDSLAAPDAGASMLSTGSSNGSEGGSGMLLRVLLKNGVELHESKRGASNPFVSLHLGKHLQKSKAVKRSLNPEWSQEFLLPMPRDMDEDDEPPQLILHVNHYHTVFSEFAGGVCVPLHDLKLNSPVDMTLQLEDIKGKGLGKLLGTVFLVATLVPRISSKIKRHRKHHREAGSRLICVDVAQARELQTIDSLDTFVKVSFGKHRHKTKTIPKSKDPVYRQRFEFSAHDENQHLKCELFRKVNAQTEVALGKCVVDLSLLEYDATSIEWRPIIDANGDEIGDLLVLVTICDLYSSQHEPAVPRVFPPKANAKLTVTVHRCTNLMAKDFAGTSDPFVMLEVGNIRLRTPTIPYELNPIWDKTFVIPVQDIFDVLFVTVWDADQNQNNDFLGKVAVPLQMTHEGEGWFNLKQQHLTSPVLGQILLSYKLEVLRPFSAYKQLIKRREARVMEAPEPFRRTMFKRNINRTKNVITFLINVSKTMNGLFRWEFGFQPSATALALWIFFCVFFEAWWAPLIIAGVMAYYGILSKRNIWTTLLDDFEDTDMEDEDDEGMDEDDSSDRPTARRTRKSPRQQYLDLLHLAAGVQHGLGQFASFPESVANLIHGEVPLISRIIVTVLLLATVVLYLVPLRWLLLVWGVRKFLKKGLSRYQPLGYFKPPKGYRPLNELVELVSRVPSDYQLLQQRRLPVNDSDHKIQSSRQLRSQIAQKLFRNRLFHHQKPDEEEDSSPEDPTDEQLLPEED